MITKLRKQFEKNLKISKSKGDTIQKPSKRWKELDKLSNELDKLSNEELIDGFSKNFNIERKGIKEKLREMRRRRNLKEKEKYGSEEDEEEQEKARKLIADSEKHFKEWLKNKEQYPFDHNNFGKKQKKDIKGMIKKILLYGGLPTLLVVSLGVLSNKKINTGKVKKNIKVKANVQEKIFKEAFVSKLKEYYKTKRKEIKKMGKEEQKNLADTQTRKENRNLAANVAENNKISVEIIKKRMKKKTPSNKVFLKIDNTNKKWSFEDEKNSNYYISKGDGKIYNKKGKLTKYIYTDEDGLGKITTNAVIPFIKTEQLKKV